MIDLDSVEGLKEQVDYFYEQLRPSENLKCFLFWYEKYMRMLIEQENKKEVKNDNEI